MCTIYIYWDIWLHETGNRWKSSIYKYQPIGIPRTHSNLPRFPARIYAPLKRQRHASPPVSPTTPHGPGDHTILPAITTRKFSIPEIKIEVQTPSDDETQTQPPPLSPSSPCPQPPVFSFCSPTPLSPLPTSRQYFLSTSTSASSLCDQFASVRAPVVGVDRYSPSPEVSLLVPECDAPMAKTVTGRRRSFAMTNKGLLVNEGDVIIGSLEDDCLKDAVSAVSVVEVVQGAVLVVVLVQGAVLVEVLQHDQ